MPIEWIVPDWPAPPQVGALMTTRNGGVSQGPYASWNLATHVGDADNAVSMNRALLREIVPVKPLWLNQVHGTDVVDAAVANSTPDADASFTRRAGSACVVMTADCLPVLFCDRDGSVVAAAHAGWRGLAGGVLEATIAAMACDASHLMAWLGPAIGPESFEVGDDVYAAFTGLQPAAAHAFERRGDKWLADIYELARLRLAAAGVTAVSGGGYCTYRDSARFFSYRRDGVTGRMAASIWLDAARA